MFLFFEISNPVVWSPRELNAAFGKRFAWLCFSVGWVNMSYARFVETLVYAPPPETSE